MQKQDTLKSLNKKAYFETQTNPLRSNNQSSSRIDYRMGDCLLRLSIIRPPTTVTSRQYQYGLIFCIVLFT